MTRAELTKIDLQELKRLAKEATPGPWCVESCGEKGDGSNMVGVVFMTGKDEALSGYLKLFDDDGNEIDYYREELVADCEHRNRNSNFDAAYIAACYPEVIKALVDVVEKAREYINAHDNVVEAKAHARLRAALTPFTESTNEEA